LLLLLLLLLLLPLTLLDDDDDDDDDAVAAAVGDMLWSWAVMDAICCSIEAGRLLLLLSLLL
jgi:hypothetical protein